MNDFNLWDKVQLPPELLNRLNEMIRRVRTLQLLRGLLATAGVAVASALVIMGIDAAVLIYSDTVRVSLTLCGLALTLLTAYIALYRPLADKISPVRMARIVETRHPELQERISSALELLGQGGSASSEGSVQLLEILASDAASDITGVSAREEFRGATLKPVIVSAIAAVAILAVLFVVWPRQTALLFVRAVAPVAQLDNLGARGFTVTPGNIVIVEGQGVDFTLTAPNESGSRAELCIERPGNPVAVERLTRRFGQDDSEAVFELALPSVKSSFRYRMRIGNALTRYYTVTAVPPPAHGPVEYILTYPEYTGLGTTQFTAAAEVRLAAPEGTRVGLGTELNRPLRSSVAIGRRTITPAEQQPSAHATFDWLMEKDLSATRWTILLRDDAGFTNTVTTAPYEVSPDYPAHVLLTYPSGNAYTLPSFGLLKMVYEIRDDYGLSEVRLAVQPDNDKTPWYVDVETEAADKNTWNVTHELSLTEFQLGGARKLRIWLEVSDSLPSYLGGPNVSKSRVIAVNLDNAQERSLADQVRIPERESLTNLLESAAQRLEAAAKALAAATNKVDSAEFDKAIGMAEEAAGLAAEEAEKANDIADKGLFSGIADEIEEVAAKTAEEAVTATENAADAEEADERRKLAEEAINALMNAAEETRDLVPEVLAKDKILEEASAMEAVAAEEARQAQKAMERQLTDEEVAKWQEKQEELAKKIEDFDLRNDVTDKEQVLAGEQPPQPQQPPEQAAEHHDGAEHQPSPEEKNQAVEQLRNEAAEAARAAVKAAEAAKAVDVNEENLKMARAAEAAAKDTKKAATEAKRAAEALESLEHDRAALEAIQQNAEKAAEATKELADDALQVKLEAVKALTEEVPPDVAKAMELAKKAETLAAMADEAVKAAQEGHPVPPEALAAQAAALREEAEKLTKSDNPFLKKSAEMAEAVAKRAEEAVAGLRAATREGTDEATAKEGLEKAAESAQQAVEAAEKAGESAERAELSNRENAVQSAQEAEEIVKEAEALHEELKKAIEAARAEEKQTAEGAQAEKDGKEGGEETPAPRDELANLHAEAEKLAEKAMEAAKNAGTAEYEARRHGAHNAANAAQKAKQAVESATRAAEAAKNAAKAELDGQKSQADQRTAEAKRFAEEAERNLNNAKDAAKDIEKDAPEFAKEAADAAKRAAELADEAVKRATGEAKEPEKKGEGEEKGEGEGEGEGEGKGEEKGEEADGSASDHSQHRAPSELTNDELKAELAKAIDKARKAATGAEKTAADTRENLPQQAASAAKNAAAQAENAMNNAERLTTPPPQGQPPVNKEQTTAAAKNAAEQAERAAEQAERLADRAARSPDEQVAALANEGRLASKAMNDTAEKIMEAARLAQEAAAEKAEAKDDAEKTAAAEKKIEEAKKLAEEAKQEAASIAKGIAQLASETPAIVSNADRVAKDEADAVKKHEEAQTPDNGDDAGEMTEPRESLASKPLPAQIAAQAARDMQRLFEEERRTASGLEQAAAQVAWNPANGEKLADTYAKQAEQESERAENIAERPGIRQDNGQPAPEDESTVPEVAAEAPKKEVADDLRNEITDREQVYAGENFAQYAPPFSPEQLKASSHEAASLADQLLAALQQAEEAQTAVGEAQQQLAQLNAQNSQEPQAEGQTPNNPTDPNNPTATDPNVPTDPNAPQQGQTPQEMAANQGQTPQKGQAPQLTAAEAAESAVAAERAAEAAGEAAKRTAERAYGLITNRESRAASAIATSEKAAQGAKTATEKLAKNAETRIAEQQAANAPSDPNDPSAPNAPTTTSTTGGKPKTLKELGTDAPQAIADLASRISAATDKAVSAREQADAVRTAKADTEVANGQKPETAEAAQEAANAVPEEAATRPSATNALHAAAQAVADADAVLREAIVMQEPTDEQIEAAKAAYKAALEMRKLATEHAAKAGLDQEKMKARKKDGKGDKARDKDKKKRPAQTEVKGGGGDEPSEFSETEYEDGVAVEMPEWLRKLGFPRSEWLKYKSSLESGLPDGALDKVDPEYRELVRRYFEVLSKEK